MGLDWNKIREEREARQGPEKAAEERERSPFDERGNLKGSRVALEQKREQEKIARQKERASRAKDKPMTRKQAGAQARKGNRTPPERREQMAKLYRDGLSFGEIARRMETLGHPCHPTTVRHVLIQDGLHTASKKGEMR